MGYVLSFYKIDLEEAEKAVKEAPHNISDDYGYVDKIVDSHCSYIDEIQHSSGSGALFEQYIKTIAADYFNEPEIFAMFMQRKDIFPFAKDLEWWGYLKSDEIKKCLDSSVTKKSEIYFEENDDFEEDLEILEEIFESAAKDKTDLLCIYS